MGGSSSIMWGILFGSIGMGYFVYGKKQQQWVALCSGIALCIFPYVVSNVFLMIVTGIVLMALPYFLRY